MALTPADARRVATMRRLGIKMPVRTLLAARKARLPLAAACAGLMMESRGGENVVGHDRDARGNLIFPARPGTVVVTEALYREYKRRRGPRGQGGMQGIGPMQLTWWTFQDMADSLGGCWRPQINMEVGFTLLADLIRRLGLQRGFAAYNGSGAAAQAYGREAKRLYDLFDSALRERPPRPRVVTKREKSARVAETYVGTRESGQNNAGALVEMFQRADRLPGIRYAWCQSFANACWRLATGGGIVGGEIVGGEYLANGTASVGVFTDWAERRGYIVAGRPVKFDHVSLLFDGDQWEDHVGQIVQVLRVLPGTLWLVTIEGNTGPSGSVSDPGTGRDGVYKKRRVVRRSKCRIIRVLDV